MKSLDELKAIKEKSQQEISLRKEHTNAVKISVGMATCGIEAGARDVLNAFVDEVTKQDIKDVIIVQTGCIGLCEQEPVVEIEVPNQPKVTYVNMTPEKAVKVVEEHIKNKNAVAEYMIGTTR